MVLEDNTRHPALRGRHNPRLRGGLPARLIHDTAALVGTLTQAGTAQGKPYDDRYRATLVLLRGTDWRILALHLGLRHHTEQTQG